MSLNSWCDLDNLHEEESWMSSGGAEAGEPTPNDEGRLDRHLLRGNYLAAIVVAIVSVVGLMLAIGPR